MFMTDAAVRQAVRFQEEHSEWASLSLRIYLAGKECDGFTYGVSFDETLPEDHHFPQRLSDGSQIDVVVDGQAVRFINDSVVDWVDDERGQGFVVTNPGHKKFRGKFYKGKNWERRLS
jgi:iron-sulfur cluster insertion protein